MKKNFNKRVIIGKLILIVIIGALLGVSCIFSSQIENLLHIGNNITNYASYKVISQDDLMVHYLDVGQADCTFIEFPDGKNMMIDAGIASSSDHIIEYVQKLGVSTIDYFILTHSDNDHIGGAKDILDTFEIKNIYRPFQIASNATNEMLMSYYETYKDALSFNIIDTKVYANTIDAIYAETYVDNGTTYQASVTVTYDGLKIFNEESGYNFEFFAPLIRTGAPGFNYLQTRTYGYPTKYYGNGTAQSKNDASPVMLLEYKEKSFIFTGDAGSTVEKETIDSLLAEEKERFTNVDVMQAGHHGSKTSNSQYFLDVVLPEYFVVSCGKNNKFGHPDQEVIERVNSLSHNVSDYLLITYEVGDITFGFDENDMLVYYAQNSGSGIVIKYYQIAICIFVLATIIIISVKVTGNKKATAKRAIRQTKKTINDFKS